MHSGREGVNKFEYGCFLITYVYDRHMEIAAIVQQPGSGWSMENASSVSRVDFY